MPQQLWIENRVEKMKLFGLQKQHKENLDSFLCFGGKKKARGQEVML